MEYISPIWGIDIGSWAVNQLIRFDVFSARYNPKDLAEIMVSNKGFPYTEITKGKKVVIYQGYLRQGLWKIFTGKIDDVLSYGNSVVILATDLMQDLKIPISRAFCNVTPQDILKYGLSKAGVVNYQLSSQVLTPRPSFVGANESFIRVIKRVNSAWSLDGWTFYYTPEERFFWGKWEESERYQQQTVPVLEYGKNILSHKLLESKTQGRLETIALPFIRHSQRIKIKDLRYWSEPKTVRVEKVHYHHSTKARSYLEWELIEK